MDYVFGIAGYLSWPAFIGISYLAIAWAIRKLNNEPEN